MEIKPLTKELIAKEWMSIVNGDGTFWEKHHLVLVDKAIELEGSNRTAIRREWK